MLWPPLSALSPELVGGGALGALVLGILAWSLKSSVAHERRLNKEIARLEKKVDDCEAGRTQDRIEREEERATYRELLQKYGDVSRALDQLQDTALKTAATVISDGKGMILNASAQALAILRYSTDGLIGKNIEVLVPPEFIDAHRRAFAYAAKSPTWAPRSSLHGPALRGDGTRVWLEIDLSRSFRRDDEWSFIAELREIRTTRLEP